MIITVTLNAALDRTLVASGFTVGRSLTVAPAHVQAGGKGINVARALRALGAPCHALGFAGGFTGAMMRHALAAEGLAHELIPIDAESRTCTAIVDPDRGVATEVNESGPAIAAAERDAFLAAFDRAIAGARLVILSGSLPAGLPSDFYALLIARARAAGVPSFLDSSGVALHAGARAAPLLAKPNQYEAETLLGSGFDAEDRRFVRRSLPRPGPAALALTLGADGAILHSPVGSWRARPPHARAVDTVGAGDAFMAGLAASLLRAAGDQPLERALGQADVVEFMLRLATATAVGNVLTVGAGRCDPADLARLLGQIEIRRLG